MTVESAIAYIKRMRSDEPFRRNVNDTEDDAANWAFIRAAGYDFSPVEFKQAVDAIYKEYGITPM